MEEGTKTKLDKKENPVKIHLACGNIYDNSWINVDNSPLTRLRKFPFVVRLLTKIGILSKEFYEYNFVQLPWPEKIVCKNIRKKLPFPSDYADFIYCSHFLEHFKPNQGKNFLRECKRVLKKEGVLRIIVPDLEAFCKEYVEKDWKSSCLKEKDTAGFAKKINEIFYREAFLEEDDRNNKILARLFWSRNQHYWMYDLPLLKKALEETGFTNIIRHRSGEGKCPDIKKLDHQGKEHLIVEAEKKD